jgi:hypothetical protein
VHRSPRATRLPVVAPYARRARGRPPVRPRSGPYARAPRSTVARQHLAADVMATRAGSI